MKRTTWLAALGLALLGAGPAIAQAPGNVVGFHAGASAGWLHGADMNDDAINQAFAARDLGIRTTSVDENAAGWKVFAGYRFDRHWAVEGGYTALGHYDFHGQVIADPGTVQASWRAGDLNAFAVGLLPLSDAFELSGKLGAGVWRTRLEVSGTFSGRQAQSDHAYGVAPIVGLGMHLRLAEAVTVRVEWERFFHVGDTSSTGRSDIDFASLGLQYRF